MTTHNSDPAAEQSQPEQPELPGPAQPELPGPAQPDQLRSDSTHPESAVTTPLSPPPPPDQPSTPTATTPTATTDAAVAADAGRPDSGSAAGDPWPPGPASGDAASRETAANGSATAGGAAGDASRRPVRRSGPKTSPIVWGALILAFCGYVAQRTIGTGDLDTAWWITATVIGLGVLLLGVGAAVLIRGRR